MFWMVATIGDPSSHSASHDSTGASADGIDPRRHRGTLPGVTRGLAICGHVRRQRLPPPAILRDSGQEHARSCCRREALRGGHGIPSHVADEEWLGIHKSDLYQVL